MRSPALDASGCPALTTPFGPGTSTRYELTSMAPDSGASGGSGCEGPAAGAIITSLLAATRTALVTADTQRQTAVEAESRAKEQKQRAEALAVAERQRYEEMQTIASDFEKEVNTLLETLGREMKDRSSRRTAPAEQSLSST